MMDPGRIHGTQRDPVEAQRKGAERRIEHGKVFALRLHTTNLSMLDGRHRVQPFCELMASAAAKPRVSSTVRLCL